MKVTRVKRINSKIKQVYVDAGLGEFARPFVYGLKNKGYHEIVSLSESDKKETINVHANTVLQTDFLGINRILPILYEGDLVILLNAGAYAMASGFPNPQPKARHVMIMEKWRF